MANDAPSGRCMRVAPNVTCCLHKSHHAFTGITLQSISYMYENLWRWISLPSATEGCRCCCLPWPIGCFGGSYAWREKLIIFMAVSGRRTCVLWETIRFSHHTWLQRPAAALWDPVKNVALITCICSDTNNVYWIFIFFDALHIITGKWRKN